MTKDEILKIKEHIEIHARKEPRAIKITEILRKAVDELECLAKENVELKNRLSNLQSEFTGLENFLYGKIEELENRNGELAGQKASLERWFGEAKEIIKNIVRVTWGEGWSYSLDWKVRAENFLKEIGK